MIDSSPSPSPRFPPRGLPVAVLVMLGSTVVPLILLWLSPPASHPGPDRGARASAAPDLALAPPPTGTAPAASARPGPVVRGAAGCAGEHCAGAAGPELRAALQAKAGRVRSCYRSVLRDRPGLRGALALSVRIGSGGQVCRAAVTGDDLGEPAVSACVTNLFRAGRFPAPDGGCVDVSVPMNFAPKP